MVKKSLIPLFGFGLLINPSFATELDTLDIVGKKAGAQLPEFCDLEDSREFQLTLAGDGDNFVGFRTDEPHEFHFDMVGRGLSALKIEFPSTWQSFDAETLPVHLLPFNNLDWDVADASITMTINDEDAGWNCDWSEGLDDASPISDAPVITCTPEEVADAGATVGEGDSVFSSIEVAHAPLTAYFVDSLNSERQVFEKTSPAGVALDAGAFKITLTAKCHSIQ